MTTIGDAVSRWRKERGWTQEELAAAAEMPQNHISAIETGRLVDPRASTLEKLARAFGVTTDELITGMAPPSAAGEPVSQVAQGDHVLRQIGEVWEGLDDEQQRVVLAVARQLQRANEVRLVE